LETAVLGVELPVVFKMLFAEASKHVLAAYQAKRIAIAREEVLREIGRGRTWTIADDAQAAMALRFLRAAQEGTARLNLRMMAQVMFDDDVEQTFAPDEFKSHADILASLSREEVIVLAHFIRADRDPSIEPANLWRTIEATVAALPAFENATTVKAHCAALGRTGWVLPQSAYGSLTYGMTPLLLKVSRLIDWEDVERCATGGADTL
jgi:hypothetical protein